MLMQFSPQIRRRITRGGKLKESRRAPHRLQQRQVQLATRTDDTSPWSDDTRHTRGVEGFLGKGGFGAVYVVRDRRIKSNLFALKELIGQDKLDRECFFFEGELLKRLDHQALPHVYS